MTRPHIAALAATLSLVSMAAEAQVTRQPNGTGLPVVVGGASTTVDQALNRLQGAALLRPIGARSLYAYGFTDGKRPATYRMYDVLQAKGPITQIVACYGNFAGVGAGITTEADASAPLPITAAIEIHKTQKTGTWNVNLGASSVDRVPLYFNGGRAVTIAPGATVCSDPLFYPLAAQQAVYWLTYAGAAAAQPVPFLRSLAVYGESTNNGFFVGQPLGSSSTASTTISGTFAGTSQVVTFPLMGGTLKLYGPSLGATYTDDGSGNFSGGSGATSISGSINLSTGSYTFTLGTAAAPSSFTVLGYGSASVSPPDETLTFAPTDSNAGQSQGLYGPMAVYGATVSTPFGLCVYGDSKLQGSGNGTDQGSSWIDYGIGASIGRVKIAQPSETAATAAQPVYLRRRAALLRYGCDRVVENYATNDFVVSGMTLATLQANKLALWTRLAATLPHGFRDIYVDAVTPRTASAASQTPYSSLYGPATVASGTPSLKNAYNAWLCTQVGVTIGGVVDLNAAVEGFPATCAGAGDGTWKALNLTFDGTHESATGYQAESAMFGVGGTAPSPLFTP